jgi:hypothetical protein
MIGSAFLAVSVSLAVDIWTLAVLVYGFCHTPHSFATYMSLTRERAIPSRCKLRLPVIRRAQLTWHSQLNLALDIPLEIDYAFSKVV